VQVFTIFELGDLQKTINLSCAILIELR